MHPITYKQQKIKAKIKIMEIIKTNYLIKNSYLEKFYPTGMIKYDFQEKRPYIMT